MENKGSRESAMFFCIGLHCRGFKEGIVKELKQIRFLPDRKKCMYIIINKQEFRIVLERTFVN